MARTNAAMATSLELGRELLVALELVAARGSGVGWNLVTKEA